MLFQSSQFLWFCSLTLILYWALHKKGKDAQNIVLLIASYYFYGVWKWTFPAILFASSLINYGLASYIAKENAFKKYYFIAGVIFNLGLLSYFKYTNFFLENFSKALTSADIAYNYHFIKIIAPLGLSFYTFQAISFLTDISRKKLVLPDALSFFTMQAFFPHLLSGPIANATKTLPKFAQERSMNIEQIQDAVMQIIWGLFKKMIVADSLVKIVSYYFAQYHKLTGSELLVGALFYSFQIYADFSGYSDMAIGIAKLFGIELSQNFAFPNFSRNIGEFWQRWHMTLSAWFKEYVYFPMGGSKGNKFQQVVNALAVFTLSGFWHGASWNYVLWGFSNGVLFLPKIFQKKGAKTSAEYTWLDWFWVPFTVLLISLTRIWFRSPDFTSALGYFQGLFSASLFTIPAYFPLAPLKWIILMTFMEWLNRKEQYGLSFAQQNIYVRYGFCLAIILLLATQAQVQNASEYIYFKF